MRSRSLRVAGLIVVVANAWALLGSWQNRRSASGGSLELPEGEVTMAWIPGESTVTQLRIHWDSLRRTGEAQGQPAWLDAAKLAELGFDCSVPLSDPRARAHYPSLLPREVFVALEFAGDAWRSAPADRRQRTRLFAIDAAREARLLEERYATRTNCLLMRGFVRIHLNRGRDGEGPDDPRARYLGGWIEAPLPELVYVPAPHARILQRFRPRADPREDEETRRRAPRFAVTLSSGRHFQPWVTAVRDLGEVRPATPSP